MRHQSVQYRTSPQGSMTVTSSGLSRTETRAPSSPSRRSRTVSAASLTDTTEQRPSTSRWVGVEEDPWAWKLVKMLLGKKIETVRSLLYDKLPPRLDPKCFLETVHYAVYVMEQKG